MKVVAFPVRKRRPVPRMTDDQKRVQCFKEIVDVVREWMDGAAGDNAAMHRISMIIGKWPEVQ
jgi:hypothetical protein